MMVEHAPQVKHDEQFPLLKVDSGGGDGTINQAPTVVAPGWNVTRSSKRSWLDRWPEFVSALWMTGILLGISLLVMYALSTGLIRKQPIIILNCNDTTKPTSHVYYHHIGQLGGFIPFLQYSRYLADMATQYPFLNFHVFFLLDDSFQSAICRRSKIFSKIYYPSTDNIAYNFDKPNLIALRDFQKSYKNVNISVLPLSKYMAMTPMKHKWRNIPVPYLPFYARVFSIWQNAGIAIDLATFNYKYQRRQGIDRRISTILQQHNDGINSKEYTNYLSYIKKEENELFSVFSDFISQIWNDTQVFFNSTLPLNPFNIEKKSVQNTPHVRTYRNKRDVMTKNDTSNKTVAAVANTGGLNNSHSPIGYIGIMNNINKLNNMTKILYSTMPKIYFNNTTERVNFTGMNVNYEQGANNFHKMAKNISIVPQVVFMYDILLVADSIGPTYMTDEQVNKSIRSDPHNEVKSKVINDDQSYILSIDSEGTFIAATSRLHPFLGHLLSVACQRMHPKFAIQNTLITQCAGTFRNDVYCNNIYLL
ncbi:uncharacterized protein LOC131842577 [Achroia grisella]|uniref:uncharacterized protein LOC131842577 n=1 Tax=Achroia grisella TaxID=688607 RepID=UPI0027D21BB9|nr:uncharacterized protein LOC131842577 [Achroia grisella]